MFNCEGCPALQYCQTEAQKSTDHAAEADRQTAEFERQEIDMTGRTIIADETRIGGQLSNEDYEVVEGFAEDVARNLGGYPARQAPLRAELWRQEAAHAEENAADIRAHCTGGAKLRANIAQILGKKTCGSASPVAQVALGKAKADLRPY